MNQITVSSSCGAVTGRLTDWGYEFFGIPYGRAERFCPPRPVTWAGEKKCTEYGACSRTFWGYSPGGRN
ncbi:MAG: carboxylesterase family protein [Lachnospiraceae bacterium]|nr:carboxylesterase family protein [Lachnospiraceae bacterium]